MCTWLPLAPQVDKLSLDRVTVFPDGELNVEALAIVPGEHQQVGGHAWRGGRGRQARHVEALL